MNSVASARFTTSKSQIPVPVKYKKPPNVSKREGTCSNQAAKIQTTNSYKTTNPCLIKELPKVTSSQPVKSNKVTNDVVLKNSKIKGKTESSLRTNIKSNCTKEKQFLAKTSVNSIGIKGKDVLLNKPGLNNGSKGKNLTSLKSDLKCLDNERKKLPEFKFTLKSADDSIKKLPTPKVIFEKENQSPNEDCFSAQKDIKFEANEKYRMLILREKELSPSVGNLLPGLRLSSIVSQRPSAYEKFEFPQDPFEIKEALQALRKASLSVRREYESGRQQNSRTLGGNSAASSPLFRLQDRGSFYTPCVDPKMEVMKSLQKRKLKQLQKSASKSTKKVTFDLILKECTPKNNTCDTELKSFKKSESRLTQINEKSEENTPNSPTNERVETSLKQSKGNLPDSGAYKNGKDSFSHQEIMAAIATDNTQKSTCETFYENPIFCASVTKLVLPTVSVDVNSEKLSSAQSKELEFHNLKETNSVNVPSNFDRKQFLHTEHEKSSECQILEGKTLNHESIKIAQAKVYTPRPVSFYSKYKIMDSSSPEFLEKPASETLLKLAPICTPLVLKSIAKCTVLSPDNDLNPVRLKLDFSEKETPRNKTSKKLTLVTLGSIVTSKNKLDELADEECCLLLLNEDGPVVCGRYLTDPVAQTLSEGDEMHFIPIQF